MVNANDFSGKTDNEIIQKAIDNRGDDGIVAISARRNFNGENRNYWLLDKAITLPQNTTVIIRNCKIKLSDKCRDNFFRTANCGFGIDEPAEICNIHITGEGNAVLEGAEHPRSTGDSSKTLACPCPYLNEDLVKYADWVSEENKHSGKLNFYDKHSHTYGTDAGREGESQCGDWRNIGVLFANTRNFSVENIKIVCSHAWGVSLEACSHGKISGIEFCANMSKKIDGMLHNIENQDGIDLRNGCHDIVISDIFGETGDDVIALTAIARKSAVHQGGSLRSTHVMSNDWDRRETGIKNVIIRNVIAKSSLCAVVRLLPALAEIKNIVIDGVIDLSDGKTWTTLLLGEEDSAYGENTVNGLSNIAISNIICNSGFAVLIGGYLKDSVLTNIINNNTNCPTIKTERENAMINVSISNVIGGMEK